MLQKRPCHSYFTDSVADVIKNSLVKDLTNARYFSLLTDGSTDAAEIEKELMYVLFVDNEGHSTVKFFVSSVRSTPVPKD